MLLGLVEAMRSNDFEALGFDRDDEGSFHGLLGRPAHLIGGETQVSAGEELNGFHGWSGLKQPQFNQMRPNLVTLWFIKSTERFGHAVIAHIE